MDQRYVIPAKAAEESTIRLLFKSQYQESLTVNTDGFRPYGPLEDDETFDQECVVYAEREYAERHTHVNTCESHASLLQRGLSAHRGFPKDSVTRYLRAFQLRRELLHKPGKDRPQTRYPSLFLKSTTYPISAIRREVYRYLFTQILSCRYMGSIIDRVLLSCLQLVRKWTTRNIDDSEQGKMLLKEYKGNIGTNDGKIQSLVSNIIYEGKKNSDEIAVKSREYSTFKKNIDDQLSIFDDRPFQLGGLDTEIDVVTSLLSQYDNPNVLEIGVSNGYSSAFLYYILKQEGGEITLIDLPRFSNELPRTRWLLYPIGYFLHYSRRRLAKRGKLPQDKTMSTLSIGGIIPEEKYAGWLIPLKFRKEVNERFIYGNAFNIVPDLDDNFDFIVLDAVKDYDLRIELLKQIDENLSRGGICIQDGYWVNEAFNDFCENRGYPSWGVGRIGVFIKR